MATVSHLWCIAISIDSFLFCWVGCFTPSFLSKSINSNKNQSKWIIFSLLDLLGGTNHEERVLVKGIAHQSVSLPCYINEENCGAIYFLTWSRLEKDDRWSRIWVYSDDNVNKALSSLQGRAIFSKQKSEARLVINSLKSSDEAFYKVRIVFCFVSLITLHSFERSQTELI